MADLPASSREERDLVLPPSTYAFVLDETKGNVNVYVGPFTRSLSATDRLQLWRGDRFVPASGQEQAIQPFVKAAEGQYVTLMNPAAQEDGEGPPAGRISDAAALEV